MKNVIKSIQRANSAKLSAQKRAGANLAHQIKNRVRRAFTLIELLVVIALTSILLTVILYPLVNSYALASRASTQIESQSSARSAISQVKTLLSNAAYIFDNSGLPNPISGSADTSLNIWVSDNAGNPALVTARNCMVEYASPAKLLYQQAVAGGAVPIDPTSGQPIYDSSLTPEQTGVALPLTPGRSLGRIFIGLIDNTAIPDTHVQDATFNPYDNKLAVDRNGMPKKPYANKFEDPRTTNSGNDNRFTLWNAEVPAFIPNPISKGNPVQFVPNLGLFHVKDNAGNYDDNVGDWLDLTVHANKGLHIALHDPNFFYDNSLAGGDGDLRWAVGGWKDLNGDGKVQISENWRAASTNLLLGNDSKIDLMSFDRDASTNAVNYFDKNGTLLTSNAIKGLPHVRPLVRFAPAFVQNDPGTASYLDASGSEVASPVPALYRAEYTHWANPYRVMVYRDVNGGNPLDMKFFDAYQAIDSGKIIHVNNLEHGDTPPDAYASSNMDVGPQITPKGTFGNVNTEFAFTLDPERGTVNFSFPSSALVHDANGNALTQVYDPVKINAGFDPTAIGKRYVDLRLALDPAFNGTQWNLAAVPLSTASKWAKDVRITPGSEYVFGPDQNHGPHYGYRTQYTRISSGIGSTIGKNQYKINYENAKNYRNTPELSVGFLEFNNVPESAAGSDDPAGNRYFENSIPEHKVVANANVLSDPIEVQYKFQMNRPNDVVKIDYLTRELMGVTIESRLYDPASSKAQTTILNEKIKVRNLQR